MDFVLNAAVWVNGYLWNYILIFLLIGMGLFFTIRTGFVQIRCLPEGFKRLFGNFSLRGGKQESGMTSFQAVATAIAAQVGTGNIVGACGAILVGGPGAIFWMWVIAFFGMATNYAEAVLAQKTRTVAEDGSIKGGPVYYMKHAFKGSFGVGLAVFFSIATVLALGFFGSMVQSNSIASAMSTAFGVPTWIVGIIIVVLAAFIYIGNVQRLASVVEKLVPIMAVLYLIGGLCVLIANAADIIPAIKLIFYCAFNPEAQVGGVTYGLIAALLQGAKRGLFSNEAGMGSTPHAHALANVKTPHEQGVVAMVAVFIDTFVVVTMTALVVISVLYVGDGPLALDATGATAGLANTNMAQVAFASLLGEGGGAIFVAICLAFFAFSTILSWNMFAKINFIYLFGKKFLIVFFLIALGFTFAGSILSSAVVWELTDTFNGLMVIPNAIALFALSGSVVACVKSRGEDCLSAKEKAELAAKSAELDEPAEA
ncbi:MAG: sodium:alanine symporter family protein [Eggerthellaceae bacterium]|nr:sodium:alanine symporter family protein [Eggerthellaceae bacterium]